MDDRVQKVVVRKSTKEDIEELIPLYGQLVDYECQFYSYLKKFKDFSNKHQ